MKGELYGELTTGPDGVERLTLPDSLASAPEQIAALKAEVAALKARPLQEPALSAKLRLGLDAGARESNAAAIAAFTAATDRQVAAITAAADRQEVGNRLLAAAFDGLTAAIRAMPPISVNPTFAPQITAQAGETRVVADIRLPDRRPQAFRITTDPDGSQHIQSEVAS